MMRWHTGMLALWLGMTSLGLGQAPPRANDQGAQEIVDRVARLYVSRSTIATMAMRIVKKDKQRNVSMQFWSLGESKILVRILLPREDAGTAILKVGDQIWYYLPKAKRTVKIQASMMSSSWMGSNFTLNDLVRQSRLTDDYEIATSFDGELNGVAVSEYTLTPKPEAAVVWGKITLEVRHADQMPVWQRFYDENGKLVRELTFSDYKTVSGRLIPTRLVMDTLDKGGKKSVEQTTITYEQIVFDEPISEKLFSLGNLKQ